VFKEQQVQFLVLKVHKESKVLKEFRVLKVFRVQ
jgi:hypothetical protein